MIMARTRLPKAVVAVVAVVAISLPGIAVAAPDPPFTPGASGAGDNYFPFAGNGGYDIRHYDLDLTYSPPAPDPAPLVGKLDGVATITLRATQNLDRFNLDLRDMDVKSLTVNGESAREVARPAPGESVPGAAYWQVQDDGKRIWELTVQPRPRLKAGDQATVVVRYGGDTTRPTDIEGFLYGWVTTRDGAMVVGQPEGNMTWFPASDHPTDKATYSYEITVPEGKVAVANGLQSQDPTTEGGRTTWHWDAPDLQASYLATASVGDFELNSYKTASGLPIVDAIDRNLPAADREITAASLALQPRMIAFFEEQFGAYPFNSYGSIVDDNSVGYALETQTRPVYSLRAREGTVAHELAHQWFGNAVSPARWRGLWMNEGWATYAEWLWAEENGGATAEESFGDVMRIAKSKPFWDVIVDDPGAMHLFADAVYDRGAATLFALREKIGDEEFLAGTRLWLSLYNDGTATTEDLEAVYEKASGEDLSSFFDVWLRTPEKPTTW